ncbi:anhydro-N-acetylmuramic acid kinase [Poseidonocella sedimentorum]|uniref:Anhydro-N-acetylmuramic acid kinase n=1 Tax=Poseidonocella sedimentorum TaxID=871652 RepID=A0A1I6DFG1_9RHOB|nr:anhydro-N-acetylmuramic acid kinase [Poseidonocella sedimentorum]SFR04185.1 anhydro-N-acetylmuramic acid kinase [Poseidonocella sedimentorum]
MSGKMRPVLGTMSGTSLDGVDAAVLVTDGARIEAFGASGYRGYSEAERRALGAVLGRWPERPMSPELARAHEVVLSAHAALMSEFDEPSVAGFHGQTLAHDPQGRGTHQLGDGAELARRLGRTVVWDFRSEDIRKGGEGAPLAPVFHFACAQWLSLREPVCFLNLGGVGNLTYVDPRAESPEAPGALLAFDTGPANAPINDLMQRRRGESFDDGGALAAQGEADFDLVKRVLSRRYFSKRPPKSLDRDAFGDVGRAVAQQSDADAAATLTAFAARAVARGMGFCPERPARLLVTGGGRKNPVMMAGLEAGCGCEVLPVEAVGLDGDMLEAQAFAFLAARVLHGLPTSVPGTTGVSQPVFGGRISAP